MYILFLISELRSNSFYSDYCDILDEIYGTKSCVINNENINEWYINETVHSLVLIVGLTAKWNNWVTEVHLV